MRFVDVLRGMETVEDHTFFAPILGRTSVVLDIGANHGAFSAAVARRFGCQCFAFEPNPDCFAAIPQSEAVQKWCVAVSAERGPRSFVLSSNSQASRLSGEAGPSVTVESVILEEFAREHDIGEIALVKMDVEGSEIEIIDSLSDAFLSRVGQVTIEFHESMGYVSLADVERVLRRMERLGFVPVKFSRSYGNTLLVNRAYIPLDSWDVFFVRHIVRNGMGLYRMLSRRLRTTRSHATQ